MSLFHVTLTGRSISYNHFPDSRSPARSKGQFEDQVNKNDFLTNKAMNMMCNTSFSWDFDWTIY